MGDLLPSPPPSPSPAPPRRGRPADAAKHAAILAAAQRRFADAGYSATSMDAIAAAAGVSKLTIYRHFNTKAALFAAALAAKCRTMLDGLAALVPADVGAQAALHAAGTAFLALILHPDALAVHRLVAGERAHAPELGRIFYDNAVVATNQRIGALIGELIDRGALHGDAATITADFLALLRSKPLLHLELAVETLDAAALSAHVGHCAEVILRAYR